VRKGLVESGNNHEQRLISAVGLIVEQAEQSIVVPPGSIDANLEPPRHLSLHSFPVPAAGEPLGRRGSDRHEHGAELRAYADGTRVDEVARGTALRRVVGHVPTEVHDVVLIIR
jgi:hypothetical protein